MPAGGNGGVNLGNDGSRDTKIQDPGLRLASMALLIGLGYLFYVTSSRFSLL